MDIILKSSLEFFMLLLIQVVISSGILSFAIVSRISREKLFPGEGIVSSCFRILHRRRLHLITALIFTEVIMIVIYSYMFPVIAGNIMPASPGFLIIIMVLIILVVSISAAGLTTRNPARTALFLSCPLFPVYFLFKPATTYLLRFVKRVFPLLSAEFSSPFFVFPDSDQGSEGFIRENGSRLVHSIVEFGEKRVREVMVPRMDIFALESHTELDEIRKMVSEAGNSRVPVYEGSVDNIIGILFVKDLAVVVNDEEKFEIKRILREAYYVPEGKRIDNLLREFKNQKKHMAIVVDEYGGTSGIVTLEDILEEIVGEIRDEDDREGSLIRRLTPGRYSVKGRININDLNEALKIAVPSEEADTLGGFLYALLGRVPIEGEEIEYKGLSFSIDYLNRQRIIDVQITLPEESE